MSPARLILVDETGAATNMARRYGRGPRGKRVDGPVPHGHWKSTTFVGGLTVNGFIAPYVTDGAMNGAIFRAWVEQMLAPELRYLPPDSPDLSPIEQAFAKLKALLRKAAERTIDGLWTAIGRPVDQFPPAECANYLANSGYVQSA